LPQVRLHGKLTGRVWVYTPIGFQVAFASQRSVRISPSLPAWFSVTVDSLMNTAKQASSIGKTFIDYFLPTPIVGSLAENAWGEPGVVHRDQSNGLEDPTIKKYCYWDGGIIQGLDGRYHMFASRWDQDHNGHDGWYDSLAVHAVSDNVLGPYVDKGLCWPNDSGGKGHNVFPLVLHDGTFAIVVSDTRPGDVFVSTSLDGPWTYKGQISAVKNQFSHLAIPTNVCLIPRHDGGYQIIARSGAVWISKDDVLGPYTVQGPDIFTDLIAITSHARNRLEDPVIWQSGGLYHVVANVWDDRKAYHLTSSNGINQWTFRGLAYDPRIDFVRYTNGSVDRWNKLERLNVFMEDGHVAYVLLSVVDIDKDDELSNDNHGSKVIVIPFDGRALDRDLAAREDEGNQLKGTGIS
jgi:hypothetical protein